MLLMAYLLYKAYNLWFENNGDTSMSNMRSNLDTAATTTASSFATPQQSADNSPRFGTQQASFFESRYNSRRASVLFDSLHGYTPLKELASPPKEEKENAFQPPPQQTNEWGKKYFAAAVDALKKIADDESHLDWLKILLGPDPVIKDEKPKTPYEKKQEDNIYLLTLFLLRLCANFHEQIYHRRVLTGYQQFVENHFQEKYAALERNKATLNKRITAEKNKEVTVKVKAYQLEEMIEGTSSFASNLQQQLNTEDKDAIQKSIALSNNVMDFLLFLDSKNYKVHELCAKIEEKIKEIEKEEQAEKARYHAEIQLINEIGEKYKLLQPDTDEPHTNWLEIEYTARGKQIRTESEEYRFISNEIVTGSASTIANKTRNKDDFTLKDIFQLFAQTAKVSRNNAIILTKEEFDYITLQMNMIINEAIRELTHRSTDELQVLVQINPKLPAVEELKNDVREKMMAFFANSLGKEGERLLNLPGRKEFDQTHDLSAFIDVLKKEVEHCIQLYKNIKEEVDPKTISDYESKKTQNMLDYRSFVQTWKTQNANKVPALYKDMSASTLSLDIVTLRNDPVPLAEIHEAVTGDTLLHKAYELYNAAGNNIKKQKRLMKAIELLYLHGADAFSQNNASEWAYRYAGLSSPSMLDWQVAMLQLKNKVTHSQYTQLLLRCLYEYCEENNNKFNKSALNFFYGLINNHEIKIDRLRCIWNILASIEKNKTIVDDRNLSDKIGELIHGDTWERKESSDLRTKLKTLHEQGVSKKILVFGDISPQRVLEKNADLHKQLQEKDKALQAAIRNNEQTEFLLTKFSNIKINFTGIENAEISSPLEVSRQTSSPASFTPND